MTNKQHLLCLSLVSLLMIPAYSSAAAGNSGGNDLADIGRLLFLVGGGYLFKNCYQKIKGDLEQSDKQKEPSTLSDDLVKARKAVGSTTLITAAVTGDARTALETAGTGVLIGGSWVALNRAVKDHDIRFWPLVGAVFTYPVGKAISQNLSVLDFNR